MRSAWGLLDLVTPEFSQTFKLAPESVCWQMPTFFYSHQKHPAISSSIVAAPWESRSRGKPFWLSDLFPQPLPSWHHQKRMQLTEHCPQEPHSVAFLGLWRSSEKHPLAQHCARRHAGSLASGPPSHPTLGPPSFCLFFIRHMFIECLLCTRDCSKCLAYISERNAQTALASWSLRSKVPILLKGLIYLA